MMAGPLISSEMILSFFLSCRSTSNRIVIPTSPKSSLEAKKLCYNVYQWHYTHTHTHTHTHTQWAKISETRWNTMSLYSQRIRLFMHTFLGLSCLGMIRPQDNTVTTYSTHTPPQFSIKCEIISLTEHTPTCIPLFTTPVVVYSPFFQMLKTGLSLVC